MENWSGLHVSRWFQWNQWSAKNVYTSINKLRCNLQFLLEWANAEGKGLNEYDKIAQSDGARIQNHGESGLTRTINIVRKAFQKPLPEQGGVMSHFVVYLKNSPVKLAWLTIKEVIFEERNF